MQAVIWNAPPQNEFNSFALICGAGRTNTSSEWSIEQTNKRTVDRWRPYPENGQSTFKINRFRSEEERNSLLWWDLHHILYLRLYKSAIPLARLVYLWRNRYGMYCTYSPSRSTPLSLSSADWHYINYLIYRYQTTLCLTRPTPTLLW